MSFGTPVCCDIKTAGPIFCICDSHCWLLNIMIQKHFVLRPMKGIIIYFIFLGGKGRFEQGEGRSWHYDPTTESNVGFGDWFFFFFSIFHWMFSLKFLIVCFLGLRPRLAARLISSESSIEDPGNLLFIWS